MHQQELRRQTSLDHLDKVTESKCNTNKRENKFVGSFQQRLKAMLSSSKDCSKVNTTKCHNVNSSSSTYRAGEEINPVDNQINSVSVNRINNFSNRNTSALPSSRPLSTLNKYTVSVSSSNLSPVGTQQATNTFTSDFYDEEESFNLRNVCNKLFSNKQYSCLQSSPSNQLLSENVISSVHKSSLSLFGDQSCFRNITPEMSIDKIATKESIYSSCHLNHSSSALSSMPVCSKANVRNDVSLNGTDQFVQTYSEVNSNHDSNDHEHVVVVSDLQPKSTTSNNGLTVRSQTSSERVPSPKIIETNQGSSLSLNVAEPSESVTSQEHNYKSSSESGRGTMNSQLEERSAHHIDLNSPADLTSLDSDQSNQEANWKETNTSSARRSDTNLNSFNKIQRYLDDQRSSASKEADLTICNEFKSKLSLHEASDSWTSLSDEPSSKKLSSKSKQKPVIGKNRHQVEPRLKTNFSKPENCHSSNSKPTSLPTIMPLSPGLKLNINLNNSKMTENNENIKSQMNSMLYDKCIYSVPNKGKYRNVAPPYDNVACNNKDCDNRSISSDPESNFPDDGCSEFTNYFNHDPLRKQLRGIEDMYSEVLFLYLFNLTHPFVNDLFIYLFVCISF